MAHHLTPLQVCERLIGPLEDIAELAGYSRKAGYPWRRESEWRGAGDIPHRAQRAFLLHSDEHRLGLRGRHLILGASEAEITAILAARNAGQVAA